MTWRHWLVCCSSVSCVCCGWSRCAAALPARRRRRRRCSASRQRRPQSDRWVPLSILRIHHKQRPHLPYLSLICFGCRANYFRAERPSRWTKTTSAPPPRCPTTTTTTNTAALGRRRRPPAEGRHPPPSKSIPIWTSGVSLPALRLFSQWKPWKKTLPSDTCSGHFGWPIREETSTEY